MVSVFYDIGLSDVILISIHSSSKFLIKIIMYIVEFSLHCYVKNFTVHLLIRENSTEIARLKYRWISRNRTTLFNFEEVYSKLKLWSCTKSSAGKSMERNSEASFQHVFIYFRLSLSTEGRGRSIDNQLLDFALTTSYSQSTFKWTITN